jgi:uncharacterized protein
MNEFAVSCPGCGRGYAADRFPFGRVLHCTCGTRVVWPCVTGVDALPGEPRFLADVMLGGLARWLRVLGHDADWEPGIADAVLVRRGVEEGRWVLTQDRALLRDWRADNLLPILGDAPLAQLGEVAARVPLSHDRMFTRCLQCNTAVEAVPRNQAASALPGDLPASAEVRRCPACERIFWEGSHTRRMRRQVAEVLGEGVREEETADG